jgi:hypothetical protein
MNSALSVNIREVKRITIVLARTPADNVNADHCEET